MMVQSYDLYSTVISLDDDYKPDFVVQHDYFTNRPCFATLSSSVTTSYVHGATLSGSVDDRMLPNS